MSSPMPTPMDPQRGASASISAEQLDAALNSLPTLDVSEHAAVYEQLLTRLQSDLHRTEQGR